MNLVFPLRRILAALTIAGLVASTAHAQTSEPWKVGSILSVTGPAAFLGEDMKAGAELAIEEINAKGGIAGRKIDWTFYDAESQTQKALSSTRRLLSQDKVDVIVGGGNMSGIAIAMQQLTEKAEVPFVASEGAMAIVQPVAERKWTFKSTVNDDQVMERLADYFDKKGMKKVALLADSSGFGQSATEQLKRIAPNRKLDVVYESFNPGDTDLTPQLAKLKAAGVQAIVCWTVTPAGVVFMKQAKALDLGKTTLIHSYGFVDERYMKLAGDAADGVLLVSLKFPVGEDLPDSDPIKSTILAMQKSFEAKFKRRPNMFAAETYDAMYLAKVGMENAKDGKNIGIKTGIEGIRQYKLTSGVFTFSPDSHSGIGKADMVLVKYDGGRFRLVDYQ